MNTKYTNKLIVDYDQTVESLVKASRHDYANSDITSKHFSTQRTGQAEIDVHVLHFNRPISSDGAIKEMDKLGLRPAELHELLAFGAQFPDEQRKHLIIALGSFWQFRVDGRGVVCLWGRSDVRSLRLGSWADGDWKSDYRFLAVASLDNKK